MQIITTIKTDMNIFFRNGSIFMPFLLLYLYPEMNKIENPIAESNYYYNKHRYIYKGW